MKHIPEAALAAHIAIVGKTGSGKTYTAKGVVEQLLTAERRVCVIDPTGAWWGLRSSADGKHVGFPVAVFGGEHADVPIVAGSGAALAELVAKRNMPAVIDLSEFLIGDRHRFMEDFAGALYRENRTPLHLVIDEADEFAPQNPLPETKRMMHRVDQIVRRGRIRGFRVMLITQRPAVLHKNVLTQANTLIAMRLTAPQDRKAIEDWIKGQADVQQGKDVLNSLARMQRGEGWVWAPEQDVLHKVTFPRIRTFDSSRTPEDGEQIEAPTKLADVDLEALRGSLDEAVEEAKANDPKELRARVRELEQQVARGAAGASPAELAAEYTRGRSDGFDAALAGFSPFIDRAATLQASIDEQLGGFIDDLRRRARTSALPATAAAPTRERVDTPAPRPTPQGRGPGEPLPRAERLILTALAQYRQGRSAVQVAVLTGYAVNGGGFRNAVGALRSKGYAEGGSERLTVTAAGMQALGTYQPLPHGDALLQHWMSQLPKAERKILEALAEVYPRTLTPAQIGNRAGYEPDGGGFRNALGRLRTLELIKGRGEIKASEDLFG